MDKDLYSKVKSTAVNEVKSEEQLASSIVYKLKEKVFTPPLNSKLEWTNNIDF